MLQLALDLLKVITEEREIINNQQQMIQDLTRQAREISDELQHMPNKLNAIAARLCFTSA